MARLALALGFVAAALFVLYRWALPKPIPGIPYNEASASRLLGDIPDLIADLKRCGDVFLWFRDQNLRSGSVINQVFTNLFGKPLVIVADAREARDMLINRSVDFDRTDFVRNLLRPIIGQGQITFPTGPVWKSQRRLSQDTMSSRFLRNVAAPNIHASGSTFVQLWGKKALLAAGRPFNAENDLFHATLDSVMVFTFGNQYPHRALRPKLKALAALSANDIKGGESMDKPVVFPHCEIAEELENIIKFVDRAEAVQAMGLQEKGWWFESRTSRYKALKKSKDDCIRREVTKALERMKDLDEVTATESARHGVDLIVNRERIMASKENRKPDYFSEFIRGEVRDRPSQGNQSMLANAQMLGIWCHRRRPGHYQQHHVLGNQTSVQGPREPGNPPPSPPFGVCRSTGGTPTAYCGGDSGHASAVPRCHHRGAVPPLLRGSREHAPGCPRHGGPRLPHSQGHHCHASERRTGLHDAVVQGGREATERQGKHGQRLGRRGHWRLQTGALVGLRLHWGR